MTAKRAEDDRGHAINYTCSNRRFQTNWKKGEPHSPYSEVKGSVFPEPLVEHEKWTLWLEHVVQRDTEDECYWLMWYKPDGEPTIPLSGVLYRDDLKQIADKLAKLVP